jgi:lipopolysaccharide/colanic/teichoic acid biosynthesis glycosyltransferase
VILKRFIDVIVAAIALLLLLPVLFCVGIAVRIDSPGPAIFRQVRIGRGCREFQIFKFRSMVRDAPRLGGHSTAMGDPRITRAGRFIRRTSLDELPQLLNVLIGDMSIVGPRPDVPAQRAEYTEEQWRERHTVRPGITGLAQATLRSNATPAQRLELDLRYVRERSMWLDIKIVLGTVRQLIRAGSF